MVMARPPGSVTLVILNGGPPGSSPGGVGVSVKVMVLPFLSTTEAGHPA